MARITKTDAPAPIQDAPVSSIPVLDLELVDPGNGNAAMILRGESLNPWGFEERLQLITDSAYDNNLPLRAKAVIDRAFMRAGKDYQNLPKFSKANRLCVKVWMESNPEPDNG